MLIQIKLWYHLCIKLHACAVLLVETPDMIFLILLHLKNPRDRFGGETNERGYQNRDRELEQLLSVAGLNPVSCKQI